MSTTTSRSTSSGRVSASVIATLPPMLCPTRRTGPAARRSISAATSPRHRARSSSRPTRARRHGCAGRPDAPHETAPGRGRRKASCGPGRAARAAPPPAGRRPGSSRQDRASGAPTVMGGVAELGLDRGHDSAPPAAATLQRRAALRSEEADADRVAEIFEVERPVGADDHRHALPAGIGEGRRLAGPAGRAGDSRCARSARDRPRACRGR